MLNKLLSGRFILTVVCGVVFAYVSMGKTIPPEAIVTIITMVFVSYFDRKDRKDKDV